VFGALFLVAGLVMYVRGTSRIGIHWTFQPVVVDGTLPTLLGFTFLIAGIYRLFFGKKRFLENKIDELIYEINKEEKSFRKHLGSFHKEVNIKTAKLRRELRAYQLLLKKMSSKN